MRQTTDLYKIKCAQLMEHAVYLTRFFIVASLDHTVTIPFQKHVPNRPNLIPVGDQN